MAYSIDYEDLVTADETFAMGLPVGTKVTDYRNARIAPVIYMIQPAEATTAQDMWLAHVSQ